MCEVRKALEMSDSLGWRPVKRRERRAPVLECNPATRDCFKVRSSDGSRLFGCIGLAEVEAA